MIATAANTTREQFSSGFRACGVERGNDGERRAAQMF
jgi:hypothetical protein